LSAIAEILTVGHSTHTSEAFVDLLRGARIELLVDVRRYPGSRRMPWFGAAQLSASLADGGIGYEHAEELGGRRAPVPDSPNGAWRVAQFRGYADHMATPEFREELARLEAAARERRSAVMCAEADWRRCHRRLLSDALVARGWNVLHLGPGGKLEPHALTAWAVVDGDRVTYPPRQQRPLRRVPPARY
jgi:uncharacterized protein (DUF488 family)